MKLKELKLRNFRGYKDETTITFDDLTVIIGRNDSGKSSLLEALDIFFNGVMPDKDDACVSGDASDIRITCIFSDLPEEIILDEQHPTSLQNEYITRKDERLEICLKFSCSGVKPKSIGISAVAHHPCLEGYNDLHLLNITQLKARARELGVDLSDVNETIKTQLRRAIWNNAHDLQFDTIQIDLSSGIGKTIWDKLQGYIPVFALFKSDRESKDSDPEAQDPMKAAVKEVVKRHEAELQKLIDQVQAELQSVANRTVEKIKEMSPDLADSLHPDVTTKKWDTMFTVKLTGDEGIPINKRGSGTRRLVLLNFFRAKAEDSALVKGTGAIYAIEEPETSQHPNHQLMLLDAFQELTESNKAQVIITTHTPTLARRVGRNALRYVNRENGHPEIELGENEATLGSIKAALGVLADHDVKIFVGVEGKWDIEFLKRISMMMNQHDDTIPDLNALEASGELVFIPLGGSSLELWVSRLAGLNRSAIYLTDRDNEPPQLSKYQKYIDDWNLQENCEAYCTEKRELENYLHPTAIQLIAEGFPSHIANFDDVPLMLAEALHRADPDANDWDELDETKRKQKSSRAKRRLNQECVDKMTPDLLAESDSEGLIVRWLRLIATNLNRSIN